MKKYLIVFLLCTLPFTQGCGVALLTAGVGYAIGQGRRGKAEILKAKAKYTEAYNQYKIEMEKINLEREKAGLKPKPVMTFEEWLDTQPLSPDEIKLFKKYKALTKKELKEEENKDSTANSNSTQK